MPITRESLNKNAVREKIIDDPNNPGNPLNIAPAQVKRLAYELNRQLARAKEAEQNAQPGPMRAYAQAVQQTIGWLLNADAPAPYPDLPNG